MASATYSYFPRSAECPHCLDLVSNSARHIIHYWLTFCLVVNTPTCDWFQPTAAAMFEHACSDRIRQFDATDSDEELWEDKEVTFTHLSDAKHRCIACCSNYYTCGYIKKIKVLPEPLWFIGLR